MNQENKMYQPSKIVMRNPYIVIPTLIIFDVFGLMGFVTLVKELLKGHSVSYFGLIFLISGSIFITYMIYHAFAYYIFVTVTNEFISGKNYMGIKLGQMRFDDIIEIYVKGKSYNIILVGRDGKKIKMNTAIVDIEELLNTIIARAVNCTRIDLKYIQKRCPNISVYTRG